MHEVGVAPKALVQRLPEATTGIIVTKTEVIRRVPLVHIDCGGGLARRGEGARDNVIGVERERSPSETRGPMGERH